ncbi:extracellular matrix protein [Stemphylium lycopersici]|uniref:Extracellular matrix protein n=1 Tax=Stemphylium lycopersici TaxID=183478 RepID=A0A364NEX3_STELY|nr:extracellular matrix protein [Stemphylium lycopersici]RAR00059.1 extracellular matrix protein [Stemphylium lycopersici]RAR15849.1 extracellular matrix protein [Stemphylium lycopersici]
MRFFETILSAAAFAALAAALEINDFPAEGVVAGQTYTITYSPADDTPTTFILRQGRSTDLDTIGTLTTSATGGSFEWTPSTDLENEADYALQIQQGETINYSAQFPLTGGVDAEDEPVSSAMSTNTPTASMTATSAGYPASSSMSMSSSMSSAMSSPMPSMTMTSVGTASASVSPSSGLNSTVTSATLSGTATGSASIPEVTANSGNSLIASPLAAMFGAAAAFAYLA